MKGDRPRIVVVGSMVMDLVFRVGRRPGPGETAAGNEFGMFLGGKGFNQAIAARRLGAEVTICGRVGPDQFGDMFLAKLQSEGIKAFVTRDDAGTGVASPVVEATGENSIIGVPRANGRVAPEDVDRAAEAIAAADVLMLQFEIPEDTSRHAARIAGRSGTLVVLDPAPVQRGAERFGVPIDYIVPNEVEAHILTGRLIPEEQAAVLLPETRRGVVISLGAHGAFAVDRAAMNYYEAYKVEVVDSTGAGDAFRAGLAVRLAEGATFNEAVLFANACGALACTILGAEPSMPGRAAVEKLMAQRGT